MSKTVSTGAKLLDGIATAVPEHYSGLAVIRYVLNRRSGDQE
jgi:hypothetical protein